MGAGQTASMVFRSVLSRARLVRRDIGAVVDRLRGRGPAPTVPVRVATGAFPAGPERSPVADAPAARSTRADPWFHAEVLELVRETADALTLVLDLGERARGEPGQFLTFDLAIGGERLRRAYSLSSGPGDRPQITVKRIAGGRASTHLVEHAEPGMRLRALGPSGIFVLDPPAGEGVNRQVSFVGGGSGITPLVAMAEALVAAEPDARVDIFYGNRAAADIIFRERIDALAAHENVRVEYVLEDPSELEGATAGLLDGATLRGLLWGQAMVERHFYLCGPEGMRVEARETLDGYGVPEERIHEERFYSLIAPAAGTRARTVATEPVAASLRLLDGRTRSFTVPPNATLLEAGLAAGLEMPFSCAMGGCGACRVRLEEGEVVKLASAGLRRAEEAAGDVLACSCKASEGPIRLAMVTTERNIYGEVVG